MAHRRPSSPGAGRGREHQIFLDPTGRRWRRLRVAGLALTVLALVAAGYTLPLTLVTGTETPGALAWLAVRHDALPTAPPVHGSGPLVRVGDTAGGPVLERSGYPAAGGAPTLSLTFDDGPDPAYTPPLLDLLSREHVPATFFVVGSEVALHPELAARAAREGHEVANHSLTHADLNATGELRARLELAWTDHILRAVTGRSSRLARLPYEGDDTRSMQADAVGIARAQRLGLVVASHDADSNDWQVGTRFAGAQTLAMPALDGRHLTVLLHDGGGDRSATLAYVADLIGRARAAGYTFTTMSQAQAGLVAPVAPVSPSFADRATLALAVTVFSLPHYLLGLLMLLAGGSVLVSLAGCLVAVVRHHRRARRVWPALDGAAMPVSAVIAAYNEAAVIERTVRSVLASHHPLRELIVVDDGSTDGTADLVRALARTEPRLRVVRQVNGGKASALNRGMRLATGTIMVTLDADTVLAPDTIGNLVRHFAADPDGRLGGVAGVVRVGNRATNLLTRWQALEYATQIGVERATQDALGAIAIVPGACAAWRTAALRAVGGYSTDTLAEDCDLSLTLHRAGWRVTQDDEALAYTEAPEDVDALIAQRTRWMFGTLQAVAKHRGLLFGRQRWLSWFVLPTYVVSILVPMLFLPVTVASAVAMVRQQGWAPLAVYFAVFIAAQAVIAAVAVATLRERWSLVLMVPLYRLAFEPLRAYLLYTTAWMALRGVRARWNKLARTGTVQVPA